MDSFQTKPQLGDAMALSYNSFQRMKHNEVELLYSGMWKRKRENSTVSASTSEGRMEGEKKLVLLSFGEERIAGA